MAKSVQNNNESNVMGIIYPGEILVLDMMDLLPKVNQWINTASQSFGNWVSKEKTLQEIITYKFKSAPILVANNYIQFSNELLNKNKK